jgi:hypothetical protein
MTTTRRIAILFLILATACIPAVGASAREADEDLRVEVFAALESVDGDGFSDGGDSPVPEGFVAVYAPLAPDGFSDGGDRPIRVFIEPAGFSDGGDPPEGFARGLAPPAPDGFSDGGDGMIAVMAQRAEGGGFVAVIMQLAETSPLPPEGGGS